jgi:putative membrane protein
MQAVEHFHEHDDEHDHEQHHDHEHPHNHRREVLQGWAKAALLTGLGVYFGYNIASGNITNYINQRFAWLSYVAAALFLILGIASMVDMIRNSGHKHKRKHGEHDDHDHTPVSWKVLAVIAVPLVLGTLIPSRPLGSSAVGGSISLSAVSITTASTFTSDPMQWNVLDWLRAFNKGDDINSFNGKQADVIGFVYREATFGSDQFMIARFTVSCCVADASAIGLPVVWDKAQDFTQDTWVEVKGAFQVGEFRGDTVPMLKASSVAQVEQPAHPYLYP